MKTRIALLLALALAGCVPSWNPFYTEKDLVFDPALIGAWRPVGAMDSSQETWEFSETGDKIYRLAQTDEDGRKAEFEARLFKLNDSLFLNLYLTKVEGDGLQLNAWASFSLVPTHLLLKVDQFEPTLKLAAMNPDWMQNYVRQNPAGINHRIVGDGNIVLTASTIELQKFILVHLHDRDFFGGPMEMKRK